MSQLQQQNPNHFVGFLLPKDLLQTIDEIAVHNERRRAQQLRLMLRQSLESSDPDSKTNPAQDVQHEKT